MNEEDKKLLDNRKDTKFSQIVRNLTGSHLKTNEFEKCVEYDKEIKRNKNFISMNRKENYRRIRGR